MNLRDAAARLLIPNNPSHPGSVNRRCFGVVSLLLEIAIPVVVEGKV